MSIEFREWRKLKLFCFNSGHIWRNPANINLFTEKGAEYVLS